MRKSVALGFPQGKTDRVRVTSRPVFPEGKGQRAKGKGQRARGKGQGARGKGQGARGKGQGARGKGQRAKGKGQGGLLPISWSRDKAKSMMRLISRQGIVRVVLNKHVPRAPGCVLDRVSRSTLVVRRWRPGGWSLLGERRGGFAESEGLDDRGLVPVGRPWRPPIDSARTLVDPVDARDPCPLAQACSTLPDPAIRRLMQIGPRKSRPFSTQSPTPLRRDAAGITHRLSSDPTSRLAPLPSLVVPVITAHRGLVPPRFTTCMARKKIPGWQDASRGSRKLRWAESNRLPPGYEPGELPVLYTAG